MEHFFRPPQHRPYTSNEAISDKVQVYTAMSQEQDSIFNNQDENQSALSNRPSPMTKQPRHSFDSLEQIDLNHSQERHTSNHPIFFCGLEGNVPPQAKGTTKEPTSVASNEQLVLHKREEPLKKSRRQPLGDVASERINKETTPLLYHLTGASRAALKPKKNGIGSVKGEEAILNKTGQKDVIVHGNERSLQSEPVEEDRGEVFSNVCNALDDSFQKYYKERLKVAQPKVLSETSFTRKDLQLSWPHRIKEHPQLRPTVMHCFSAKQDSETSLETLTPSVTSEGTEVGSLKKEATEMEKGQEGKMEHGRPVNVAQPQVARIGGRRRLTAEQKMCYSEPEKLHQLGDSPNHSYCHSLGNEDEHFFSAERHGEEPGQHGERGLVAARRKMFETRGRASSASSLSKTNLKNLQHKALVDYMERKTGQKVAEPQQPGPQLPPAPRQRHSIGEKPVEWGAKSPAASTGGQGFKKQLNRPHSAGRILDSSSSSIRYAQFSLAQSGSVRCIGKPGWKEGQAAQGKAASVESLLNHIQTEDFVRNRSISSPQTFQELGPDNESSPASTMETQSRKQRNPEDVSVARPALEDVSVTRPAPEDVSMARPALEDVSVTRPALEDVSVARPAPDVEQRVRVVAQRGKSMEELGVFFKCTRALVLSRSSEQLDQSWSHPARPERKKSNPSSVFGREHDEVANARGQGLEMSGLEKAQALGQKPTQKISLSKAHLTAQLGMDEEAWPPVNAGTNDSSRPPSPASTNSSRDRSSSGTPGSHGSVTEEARPSSESSNQQPPNGQEIREMKSSSSSSLVNQTRFPKESEPCSKDRKSPTVTSSEQSSDDPTGVPPRPDSNQEVSTPSTPSPDISDEHAGSPLPDNVFEDNSTGLESPAQSSERLKSPSNGVADGDGSHFAEREETAEETANVDPAEGQEVAERGAPGARTESSEETGEKPRWAELAAAVVQADGSLARAIYPLANRKTALMLMEQLLSEDTLLMEEHYKKKQEQGGVARSAAVEPPPASDSHTEQRADPQSQAEITEKKRLLLSHVEERLRALEETRGVLREEIRENEVRGQAVLALVRQRCLPVELERYGLFIGDLERVVSLLLCLSARLARVQNALSTVDQHTDAEEKQSLDSRHRLLCKQREDAKDLKDNLDRREGLVSAFLSRQLSAEQLAAYRRFVQTTASLLIRQKDLDERQQLGEEQMLALRCSLPPPPP